MRIVAGIHRGRRLLGPSSKDIRPTADRVRESIFNLLGQECGGLRILDLFAGTGAMGLEALSRGAHSALLVDSGLEAARLCRQNISNLGLGVQAGFWRMDVFLALSRCKAEGRGFELLFADPPYAFRGWGGLWQAILEAGLFSPGGKMVVEREKRCVLPVLPSALSLQREVKFGDTVVSILLHSSR